MIVNNLRQARRVYGDTARQQRIRKRKAPGSLVGKIIARRLRGMGAREDDVQQGRKARRFLDGCNGGPGWDRVPFTKPQMQILAVEEVVA